MLPNEMLKPEHNRLCLPQFCLLASVAPVNLFLQQSLLQGEDMERKKCNLNSSLLIPSFLVNL